MELQGYQVHIKILSILTERVNIILNFHFFSCTFERPRGQLLKKTLNLGKIPTLWFKYSQTKPRQRHRDQTKRRECAEATSPTFR